MNAIATNYQGTRICVISPRTFDDVVARFGALISHPDMRQFLKQLEGAQSAEDLARIVHEAVGEPDLMEFMRFNLGAVLQKRFGAQAGKSVRILVGNPLTMSSMAVHVPDAGSYAPVTVLIDERPDGTHLSYDAMEQFLEGYGNEAALEVARDLDAKVLNILQKAAE